MFPWFIERWGKSWLIHGMVFSSTIVLVPYTFPQRTGVLWVVSPFLTAPWTIVVSRALVFPRNIDNTSMFRRRFPSGLPFLVRSFPLNTSPLFDIAQELTRFHCTVFWICIICPLLRTHTSPEVAVHLVRSSCLGVTPTLPHTRQSSTRQFARL